jgi:hypothetical protein
MMKPRHVLQSLNPADNVWETRPRSQPPRRWISAGAAQTASMALPGQPSLPGTRSLQNPLTPTRTTTGTLRSGFCQTRVVGLIYDGDGEHRHQGWPGRDARRA